MAVRCHGVAAAAALAALALTGVTAQTSLGTMNGIVYATCVMPAGSSTVYYGGAFTAPSTRIGKYDGATWSGIGYLGVGANGAVYSLLNWDDAVMYVGGLFSTAGGSTMNRITKYTVATNAFTPVPTSTGANNAVLAMARNGDILYAGGTFTTMNGIAANYIAAFNTVTSTWSAMGSGLGSSGVKALYMWNGLLYVVSGPCCACVDGVAAPPPHARTPLIRVCVDRRAAGLRRCRAQALRSSRHGTVRRGRLWGMATPVRPWLPFQLRPLAIAL